MRNIKRFIIYQVLLIPVALLAQFDVRDNAVTTLRAATLAEVTALTVEKGLVTARLKALAKVEQEYQMKINAVGNLRSSLIYLGLIKIQTQIGSRIANLEAEVAAIEKIPFFLRHGIKAMKSDLKNEKRHYEEASQNIARSLLDAAFAGGAGYNYTNWLKKFLQMRRIQSSLQEIQYRLDNSGTINRYLIWYTNR